MVVLVVDDSKVFRRVVGNEIREGGYEVLTADSGREALEALQGHSIDCVSLDVEMPEIDGYQVCELIRMGKGNSASRDNRNIPVVFVTGLDTVEGRERGFAVGATDFVTKNYRKGELAAAIDRILKPEARFGGLTGLVVDDLRVARRLAAECLREQGLTVIEAEDGQEAFDILSSKGGDFDLILTDNEMPRMTGLDLCRKIRGNQQMRELPVIFLCSPTQSTTVLDMFHAGATDYVPKPFTKEEFLARLCVHLQTRTLTRELRRFNQELEQRVRDATAEIRFKNTLLERRVKDLGVLNATSMEMGALMEVDKLLERIVEYGKRVMNAEAASLLLYNKETNVLEFHVAQSSVGQVLKPMAVAVGTGLAGWVAEKREPLLVPDAYNDPRFDPSFDKATGFRTRSVITAPVMIKDDLLGVVQILNRLDGGAFDDHDLNLMVSYTNTVGLGVENARLFEQTRKMAGDLRDALEKERRLTIEKEKMGAYIPKHVVEEISRNREKTLALGGKSVMATILFSDLKGFTSLSESLPPQAIVNFLNAYMTAMSKVIESEGGIIDKFIGDAIMAVFLDRPDTDPHALRAVRSGVGMQRRLEELRPEWARAVPQVTNVQMRIGINTGQVVAGNIGSESRMDYTVIGDNVNVASRLESNGIPGEVLISESTFWEAGGNLPVERLEPLHVKNRAQPVPVYRVEKAKLP